MACAAEVELADTTTLVCELDAGHPGPVHRDGDQEWGDGELLMPLEAEVQWVPPTD